MNNAAQWWDKTEVNSLKKTVLAHCLSSKFLESITDFSEAKNFSEAKVF